MVGPRVARRGGNAQAWPRRRRPPASFSPWPAPAAAVGVCALAPVVSPHRSASATSVVASPRAKGQERVSRDCAPRDCGARPTAPRELRAAGTPPGEEAQARARAQLRACTSSSSRTRAPTKCIEPKCGSARQKRPPTGGPLRTRAPGCARPESGPSSLHAHARPREPRKPPAFAGCLSVTVTSHQSPRGRWEGLLTTHPSLGQALPRCSLSLTPQSRKS